MAKLSIIIQEAGGLLSNFNAGNDYSSTGNLVAGSPKVFKGLLQTIQPHLPEALKK
jgi:myo-inositol-1(or 4)-monophosphatase